MHDGIVFVAIIVAVILQGILGALIVIPVLASLGVIGRYIYRRLLGLPPFPEPALSSLPSPPVTSPGVPVQIMPEPIIPEDVSP